MAVSTTARYVRGEWTALVTENGTALLHPLIDEDRVRGVWDALREGTGVNGCLEVLASHGLTALPAFALVQHAGAELRVLVRGEATITAGESTVGAAGIATWREALIPAQSYRIVVSDDGATGPAWPLSAGIVLASAVEWEPASADVTVAGAEQPAQAGVSPEDAPAEAVDDDEADDGDGAAAVGVAAAVEAIDEPVVAAEEVADEAELPADEAGVPAEDPAEEAEVPVEEAAAPLPEPADEIAEEHAVEDDDEPAAAPSLHADGAEIIDSLPWAVSAADRQEAAAQEPSEAPAAGPQPDPGPVAEAPPEPPSHAHEPATQAPGPQAADATGWDSDLPEHTVLSSHAPNAAAAAASASGNAPVPPWQPPADMSRPSGPVPPYGQGDADIDGDHDGQTIMVSELPKDQDMTIVPGLGDTDLYDEPGQPPAGSTGLSLSVSTGAEVPLDRPVLIGRAPESARFSAGVQPRLVTVPSPEQDISRTHVEVRAEGSSAVVTDLNSTNGTVVIQPGSAPRRLHGSEGASVPVGTLIDLGDGVTANVHAADQGSG